MENLTRKHGEGLLWNRYLLVPLLGTALALGGANSAQAQEQQKPVGVQLTSLITKTPEEGFALAIKMSQKAVATTQRDASVRKVLRNAYAHDPDSLIAVSHVVATNFQTIAAANNYWRE